MCSTGKEKNQYGWDLSGFKRLLVLRCADYPTIEGSNMLRPQKIYGKSIEHDSTESSTTCIERLSPITLFNVIRNISFYTRTTLIEHFMFHLNYNETLK